MNHYPKRALSSFMDLEVYQRSLAVSVAIAKRIPDNCENATVLKLKENALKMPPLIASAHSLRFSDQQKAINILEEVMLSCNLTVVYLEQYRDIINENVETEFFEEQIKNLLSLRNKILHLQFSWKKFLKNPG